MLMENNKLQNLSVCFNKIDDNGIKEISEGLHHNNTLIKLDAENCAFSVKGS